MKGKILFVSPYPVDKAPSQRLKFEQYYSYFKENGYELTTNSFIDEDFWKIVYKPRNYVKKICYTLLGYLRRFLLLFTLRKYDVVYIHLWVTPIGPPFFEYLYRAFAKKVVYDIDDLIFLKPKSKANPIINMLKSGNKPIYLMKHADHVITCTPHLDTFVRQYNQSTTDISSTINTDVYQQRSDYSIQGRPIVLGWSGSHSTSKYVYLLKDVLRRLSKEMPLKLLVIGDPAFNISGVEVEAIKWNEATEVKDLGRIDIGLYPLPDEEWVLGKSGLKALQYMALGIPTVATAIGANFRVIESGISGFLVTSEEEWYKRIKQLTLDQSLRHQIGVAAAKRVRQYYSIKANAPVYLSIINSLN
ncbi:glycosyltransferase family 4 protein [Rufibacter tibetensis]|uniref:Group 1 glycosyl transferase n=1 Tax=Rufibacter tibetensis TaxID=512763 RepID=A0A0P0CT76_9BACT|nr:glycosyltransferase family 4 protein [Rufibacter tibetensis]ALI99767.1 hypothetical protein DC20_13275 [Rufibacter tibetensis]